MANVRRVLVALLLMTATTVSTGPAAAAKPGPTFTRPVSAIPGCAGGCFEPTVTVDRKGRIFVTSSGAGELAVSSDGGETFLLRSPPPFPPGVISPTMSRGDAIVQTSPSGRLYFSALVLDSGGGGVQVAWSDNGGKTWGSNVLVALISTSPTVSMVADRQWIAFGNRPGVVYLSYSQIPTGLWVLRSTDGGATFPQFARAVGVEGRGTIGQAGPVIRGPSGRLYLPHFTQFTADHADRGLSLVQVATSDDDGKTFVQRDAFQSPGQNSAGGGFPVLSVDRAERLSLVWWRGEGITLVTTSVDRGKTWTKPVAVAPFTASDWTCPWIASTRSSVDVLAFDTTASGPRGLTFSRRPARGGSFASTTVAGQIESMGGGKCNTDFAYHAYTPGGCAVVPWADRVQGVLVSVERTRGSAGCGR